MLMVSVASASRVKDCAIVQYVTRGYATIADGNFSTAASLLSSIYWGKVLTAARVSDTIFFRSATHQEYLALLGSN
jgi:hypothetical protein